MTGLNKYEGKARRMQRLKWKKERDRRRKPVGPFLSSSYKQDKLKDFDD
jgi:hypothetical protein